MGGWILGRFLSISLIIFGYIIIGCSLLISLVEWSFTAPALITKIQAYKYYNYLQRAGFFHEKILLLTHH